VIRPHSSRASAAQCLAILVLAAACDGASFAGGTKGQLRLLGGFAGTPSGVSSDGRVVVGYNPAQYWYWTSDIGVIPIGGIAPGSQGAGGSGDISDDGSRIGYTVLNPDTGKTEGAFYEVPTGVTTRVGSFGFNCDISATSCWGLSGDGATMVGLGWHSACEARGYSYNPKSGLVDLGTIYFFESTRANACSRDGSTIVGWQDFYTGFRQATVWRNGVQQVLFAPGNVRLGEAAACSADGNWVVGLGSSANNELAWRWSQATGYIPLPPTPIPGFNPYATDISNDGSRVLMFYRVPAPPATSGEGYLWINGTLHSLEEYAAEQGVQIDPGVRLALPLAISGDGYTIVGSARTPQGVQGFVLDLPRPAQCVADLNGDGQVAAQDIAALLSDWGSTTSAADLNGDGSVGAADITVLLSAWGVCP
jgi:hypothetical protein